MTDWADEKAREWLVRMNLDGKGLDPIWLDTTMSGTACVASLAALLREVAEERGREVERLKGEFQTESAERVRCRDGWAQAEGEIERLRALMAGILDVTIDGELGRSDCYCGFCGVGEGHEEDCPVGHFLAAAQQKG